MDKPKAIVAGKCTNYKTLGWAPVGVHQIDLKLAPNSKKRFHFILGYAENPENKKFEKKFVANKAPFRKVAD